MRYPLVSILAVLFATAPLVADEAMGEEEIVTSSVCSAYAPAIAYGSQHGEFMAAWAERCAGETPEWRVLARRLDRYARPVGDAFLVGPTGDGRDRFEPSITYDSTLDRFLVAYTHDFWGDQSDFDVRARYLAWNGLAPGWLEFGIASTPVNEWRSDLTYAPGVDLYFAAWSQDGTLGVTVWGARFAADQAPLPFAIEASGYRASPSTSFDQTSGNYFIAYEDAGGDILGRALSATMGTLGPEQMISDLAESEINANAASCGTGHHLVTWDFIYSISDLDVFERILSGTGVPISPTLAIANSTQHERLSDAACLVDGSELLVVHEKRDASGTWGVDGRRLVPLGPMRANFSVRVPGQSESGIAFDPAVAGGRLGWVVAWQHQRQGFPTGTLDLHARAVWALFSDGFEWGSTANWSATSP